MQTNDIIVVISLALSIILLLRTVSLQRQLNDVKSDLEWIRQRPHSGNTNHSYTPLSKSNHTTTSSPAPTAHHSATLEDNVFFLLQQGKKINAIKDVREAKGWGLKEAKDYVDQLEIQYKQKNL